MNRFRSNKLGNDSSRKSNKDKLSPSLARDLLNVEDRLQRYRSERRMKDLKAWLQPSRLFQMVGPYLDHVVRFNEPVATTSVISKDPSKISVSSNGLNERDEDEKDTSERSRFLNQKSPPSSDFKNEDLDDGLDSCQPCRPRRMRAIIAKLIIYAVLQYFFIVYQFGAVFFCVACFYLIFSNLSERRRRRNDKTMSAYSVFNPSLERLPGTVTAEQLQAGLVAGSLPLPMAMSV